MSEQVQSKVRKTTVNLAIDSEIIDELKKDAKSKGVSLNSQINAVLSKHIKFFKRTEEIQSLIISPRQWETFLDMMDENKTIEIMKSDGSANNIIAYFKHNNIPLSTESLIRVVFESISQWTGMSNKFSQYMDEHMHRHLVFDHRYGIKWSRILSTVFSDLINESLHLPTSVSVLPDTFEIVITDK